MKEDHLVSRIGWLRAAVLGANDGLISTASLVVGVASAATSQREILLAGAAGLVAGAMSMAAGEYVSVSSQADAEQSDTARERAELAANPQGELDELTHIYVSRGVEPELARQVAEQMTTKDALGAHLRDELAIVDHTLARPGQAAGASGLTFAVGAAPPIMAAALSSTADVAMVVSAVTVVGLAVLGAAGAHLGGAPLLRGTARVVFWGVLAMGVTALIGRLVGHSV